MKVLGLRPHGKDRLGPAASGPAVRQAADRAAVRPAVRPAARRIMRQRRGYELVGGESETEDAANFLTCTLARFEAHMRAVYPDWQEFTEWVEDRRVERLAAGAADAGRYAANGGRRRWVWGWPDGAGGGAAGGAGDG